MFGFPEHEHKKKNDKPTVAVYLGSRMGKKPRYAEYTREFAEGVAKMGFDIVYGGAGTGLMGILADTAMKNGAKVTGVMTNPLIVEEKMHLGLNKLMNTENMFDRKAMMTDLGDAFVALPGGMGTVDEIINTLTHMHLHRDTTPFRPFIVCNTERYYEPLRMAWQYFIDEGFITPEEWPKIYLYNSLDQVLAKLKEVKDKKLAELAK